MKPILIAFSALIGSCLAAEITVDPAGATLTPGPGITITGNNAWTTAAATWTGTEWNTGTSVESWSATNTTATVTGGILSGTSSNADPYLRRINITGGPDLDLGWNDFIDIRIKLPLNYAGNIEIYYGFTATTDAFASQTGFAGTRMVTIPNSIIAKDNAFHVYRIDMGLDPLWRGKLSDLRIDPATISGTAFSLDYVRIGDVPGNDYTARISENCPAHGTVKVIDGRTHTIRSMESKRFRIIYSNLTLTEDPNVPWSDAKSRGTLRNLEEAWQVFIKKHGYREPCYPMGQSSGTKFKTNMTMIYLGGTWATGDNDSANGGAFGWQNTYPAATRVDEPSWVTPHEFMHVCQMHQGGGYTNNSPMGKWWEAHANYGRELYLNHFQSVFSTPQTGLSPSFAFSSYLFHSHGRHYYDSWPIFTYLDENPDAMTGLGSNLTTRLWQESTAGEYLYATIQRLAPSAPLKDVIGNYARRNATWNYSAKTRMQSAAATWNQAWVGRYQFPAVVKRVDDPDWWEVPSYLAPQAFAYTIHPLTPVGTGNGRVVSVDFLGREEPDRQSDWRASLVVISDSGAERYSPLWSNGVQSVTLSSTENKVYLAVAATPGEIQPTLHLDTEQPYQSHPARTRFPYTFKLTGAVPKDPGSGSTSLVAHSNGGGLKATTATVASSAYLGPDARVLDYAVVSENARIEGNAVVSGHALVRGSAIIRGNARVRGYALIEGTAIVEENARVGDHSWLFDQARVAGTATVKGSTELFGSGVVSGDAVLDGDAVSGANIANGFQFGWEWGGLSPSTVASRTAPAALFAHYDFSTSHPYAAKDKYGVTDAALVGAPTWLASDGTQSGVMGFNGSGQRAVLSRWLNDLREFTVVAQVKWSGTGYANQSVFHFGDGTSNNRVFLTPSNASGVCALQINSGGNSYTISAASALPANTWTRVGVTLDGTTARLFLNGALAGSTACPIRPENLLPADTNETPAHNFIAAGTSLPDFQGSIDDFKVYSVAMPGLTGVSLSPLAANLPEMSGPLTLTFSRNVLDSALLASPLLVNYTVTGSATPGVDFIGLAPSGSVTIPAGQTSTSVQLTPIIDATTEVNESFSVNVIAGTTYGVSSGPATLTLQDPVPLQNDLLAWYKFDETTGTTANDSSANNNDATLINGPAWTPGSPSYLSFDGTDDDVQSPVANGSARTLAAWIYPRSSDNVANIESVFDCDVPGQYGTGWGLNGGTIRVILDDQFWNTGVPVTLNQWQHVALAFDAAQARIYVNGVLRATLDYTQGGVTAANFRIGRSNANTEFFHGYIRDAKIYSRAVNDIEILEVQQGNQPAPTAAPSSLTATPVSGGIMLSWQSANNGETWYTVRRATSSGGPYTTISGAVIGTTFTDTTATPGTTYFYVVVAANSSGSGPESTNASATAIAPTDGTWSSGTSGNWSDPGSWLASLVANGADRIATFSPASAVTVTQNLPGLALGGLSFTTANSSISGNPITLDVATGTPAVQVASGIVATIPSALSGADGLEKSGPGSLVLSGAILYTGGTTVSAGTLSLQNTYATNAFTIASGAGLNLDVAATRDFGTTTFSGAGTLRKTGAGEATWGASAATFAMNSGSLIDVQAGGRFVGGSYANENWTNNKSDLNVASGAVFDTVEANVRVNRITGAGTLKTGYSGAGYQNLTIGVDGGGSQFDGVITNSSTTGNLVKEGSGTIILSAVNTYTGTTTINGGVLAISGQSAGTGGIRGSVTVNTGGELRATGPNGAVFGYTTNQKINTFNIIGGIVNTSVGSNHIWAATVNLTGGTLKLDSNASNSPTGTYYEWGNTPVNTLASSNPSTIAGRIRIRADASPALTFTVADGAASTDLLVSAAITESGSSGITKAGPGTLLLSGSNTYTGTTNVNAGTLLIHGSTAASSSVTVADAATLGGTGTIGGAITVQANGTIAPGASIGTLNTASAAISGTLAIEIDGAAADRLNATGNLNITNATLGLSGTPTGPEVIIASFGSLTGSSFASVTGLPNGYQVTYDLTAKQIKLTATGFAGWIGPFAVSNPAANADPDFDGIPNALEYVLGGDPSQPNSNLAPAVTTSGENLVFTFQRADTSETPDIALIVEAGTNLSTWPEAYAVSPGTPSEGVSIQENGSSPDSITVTIPQGTGTAKFARLRVIVAP